MSKPPSPLTSTAACAREYGRAGLFGVLTPQGNPIAEPELKMLLPTDTVVLSARLTSPSPDLRQRLIDYRERLSDFVDQFDDIAFDAVGFACTGSFYEIDREDEQRQIQAIAARKGYPVITAARAVEAALDALGAGAFALVSPYPVWLTGACRAHWERRGMRVTASLQLPPATNKHRIYSYTTPALLEAVGDFDARGAEAILLAGTGLPSLRAIRTLELAHGVPVLSSNLCLAWALARITSKVGPGPESRLYGGWAERLSAS